MKERLLTPSQQPCPPPRRFRPATNVGRVELANQAPAFAKTPRRLQGAKGNGIRYERKAQSYLSNLFGAQYLAGPWFIFEEGDSERWCQPDGLLFLADKIVLVEIKLAHCALAWWQLEHLYLPVVRHFYGDRDYATCEVVRWYDPAIAFPRQVTLLPDLRNASPTQFSVHICKP